MSSFISRVQDFVEKSGVVSDAERQAILNVLCYGDRYGYGNLMSFLRLPDWFKAAGVFNKSFIVAS